MYGSILVTVDVVDIVGERKILAKIGKLCDSEKSADYHKSIVKSSDLYILNIQINYSNIKHLITQELQKIAN